MSIPIEIYLHGYELELTLGKTNIWNNEYGSFNSKKKMKYFEELMTNIFSYKIQEEFTDFLKSSKYICKYYALIGSEKELIINDRNYIFFKSLKKYNFSSKIYESWLE